MTSSVIFCEQESADFSVDSNSGRDMKSSNKESLNPLPIWEKIGRFQEFWEGNSLTSSSSSSSRRSELVKIIDHVRKFREEELRITKLLGRGAFADVNEANERGDSDKTYAIKRLRPSAMANRERRKVCIRDLAYETAILSNLKHNNIISLLGVMEGDALDLLRNGHFFVAIEIMSETLSDRLKRWKIERIRQKKSLVVDANTVIKRLKNVVLGIVSAMEYLHSNRILYRDTKPSNIGFDDVNSEVKLFDFGFARVHNTRDGGNVGRLMTGGIGTPRYMAPEVAKHDANYGFPVDVYSFSIMLWQIITNITPFKDIKSLSTLASKVVLGNKRPRLRAIQSEDLRKLLKSGWSTNPADRPTFSEVREVLNGIINKHQSSSSSLSTAERPSSRLPKRNSLIKRYFSKSSKASASTSASTEKTHILRDLSTTTSELPITSRISKHSASQDRNERSENSTDSADLIIDTYNEYVQSLNDGARTDIEANIARERFSELQGNMSDGTLSLELSDGGDINDMSMNDESMNDEKKKGSKHTFFQRTKWKTKRRNSVV